MMPQHTQKKLAILGSTGSIGTQCLEVVADHPDLFQVVGISGHKNLQLLVEQARKFQPKLVVATGPEASTVLPTLLNEKSVRILSSADGLLELATHPEVDQVVVATVGAAGLQATLAALEAGKSVALANKEVLVMGGELVMEKARRYGVEVLPIDSEHSAIFQCSRSEAEHDIARIVVTASGGPFRTWSQSQINQATLADALNHPTWDMGSKITIDSATLMNKGLEIIEAHHFFGLPPDRIDVVVHPQSIIHSLVEYVDGSVLAQLGHPDMRVPIQYALSYPYRLSRATKPLDLAALGQLTFEVADQHRFPCLKYAYEALREGGSAPTVLSVANECAVQAFQQTRIRFVQISHLVATALDECPRTNTPSLEQIMDTDTQTRRFCSDWLERQSC